MNKSFFILDNYRGLKPKLNCLIDDFNSSITDTDFKEKNESQTFRIDYEDGLNEALSIEIGMKATLKSFSTDYSYLDQLYINNYSEDIYAGYASATYDLTDRFGIKAGARYEKVETNASLSPSSSNTAPSNGSP